MIKIGCGPGRYAVTRVSTRPGELQGELAAAE